ncbi:MAG TPA: 30S ribosomal protein S4 [Oligoflexia bacterium]|nr:30S ribosomal protein S4 [Oligoflexia bacterium]HMP49813.1 30S ribosomal protein S4 [Oligoflexia bacterium]
MARYCGSVCRLCRREGEKLFLKGDRCYTNKCAIEKREGQPGQHSKSRGKFSEYKIQLREKQKIKRTYGLLEKQFRGTFKDADRMKGVTGTNLLRLLESRLDNMVYRAGFAGSRAEARQLVTHGHFLVNGQKVNIPSYRVKPGDVLAVKEKSRQLVRIGESLNQVEARKVPDWIELQKAELQAVIRDLPTRDQLPTTMREQLVVELYSK